MLVYDATHFYIIIVTCMYHCFNIEASCYTLKNMYTCLSTLYIFGKHESRIMVEFNNYTVIYYFNAQTHPHTIIRLLHTSTPFSILNLRRLVKVSSFLLSSAA